MMSKGISSASLLALGLLLLSLSLFGCTGTTSAPATSSAMSTPHPTRSISGTTSQPVTYSTDPQDVLIRIFHGGGKTGALSLAPQISIYGDGSYIFGTDQRGKLSPDALQSLLTTLVNQDGLLTFTRQVFSDVADQNMTFLELELNGRQKELVYGSFGHYQASEHDMDEYHRLEQALTTITETLPGPAQPYSGTRFALLAREVFNQDPAQSVPDWSLNDFTLAQAAAYECGPVPADETSQNAEIACLKFTIPARAVLLTPRQASAIKALLHGSQGTVSEQGLYYSVTLRPLLPDELAHKSLAMLGGNQESFIPIALHEGSLPPAPTPTPAT